METQILKLSEPLWLETLQKIHHDIYHLPEYLSVEATRVKAIPEAVLIEKGDKVFFLPYLIRKCGDFFENNLVISDIFDVVSPYGYPGVLLSEAAAMNPDFLNLALSELKIIFASKNICSSFFRLHPVINRGLNNLLSPDVCIISGETVSVNLENSLDNIWKDTRPEHRNHINRCKRAGFTAQFVDFSKNLDEFILIYNQTMSRVAAEKSFFFEYEYFTGLANLGEKIHLCTVELDNQIACAGIFTECCGIVQYHLGGTKDDFLKKAPSKLMFDYVRFWAKERGNKIFHLGGGVGGSKDSLYNFKCGFSKQRNKFLTLRLITDEPKYMYLLELRAKILNTQTGKLLKSNFFPAYRSQ